MCHKACVGAVGIVLLFFVCPAAFTKDVTVHGFVTDVKSPTNFAIDDYKITRDNTVLLDLDRQEGDKSSAIFKPEDIRIGTELEIKGEYDETSGRLTAKSIKVFVEDTAKIKRTALIEKIPLLTKEDAGWKGEIYADGQTISVSPATSITLKPNQSERKKLADAKQDPKSSPLTSLDSLTLDTFIHYEGTRAADGSIKAEKIEFQHAELETGEAKLWKHYDPKVKDPDYSAFAPGQVKMPWKTYKTVPNREAQEYLSQLGESLIPAHQKELAPDDPLKIPFRFYLVQAKSFNAVTYPNGVVVVHSGVFDVLQNEAQLAFVLSHEISHAVEKHAWEQHEYHRYELIALRAGGAFVPFGGGLATNLFASGIQNEYARSLENQADRVALEWTLAAGYDIREAPQSWKAVSEKKGDRPLNPFWDSHDNNTTRRSYLMAELRNNYSAVDYSKLKKDREEFHHVAELVRNSEDKKTSAKVKE
ncbi:MAG: M48 family metallopeptidase [Candidatus Sulfotelmatobacter sp.]